MVGDQVVERKSIQERYSNLTIEELIEKLEGVQPGSVTAVIIETMIQARVADSSRRAAWVSAIAVSLASAVALAAFLVGI